MFNENILISRISEFGEFQLEQKSEQTVTGILDNVKLFLGYKYPLLSPLEDFDGIGKRRFGEQAPRGVLLLMGLAFDTVLLYLTEPEN